ncbi:hypothetical protein ACFE04_005104 [Oxalis oulophora]
MRASIIIVLLSVLSVSVCNGDRKIPESVKQCKLEMNFYHKTCRDAETIVRDITRKRVSEKPELAAKLLRLHFHDCFVRGCEASVLLDSVDGNTAEKDALPNLYVSGYDIIVEIKTELENKCPGQVSCADILALSTRDAVSFKFKDSLWPVFTGRKDGKFSNGTEALLNVPTPGSNFSTLQKQFADFGLYMKHLVALSGAHTIGVTHCNVIQRRLYNFTGKGNTDTTIDPDYAQTLKRTCPIPINRSTEVMLDPNSSLTFDSDYFRVLRENKGVFVSDATLLTNPKSKSIARSFENQKTFFDAFAEAMVKMSSIGVITGDDDEGEIRKNCRFVNK